MRRLRQLTVTCALILVGGSIAGCAYNDHDGGGRRYGYNDNSRGWWGRSDARKEDRYENKKDNGRSGDAENYNRRLCRNGIPGDAPAGC